MPKYDLVCSTSSNKTQRRSKFANVNVKWCRATVYKYIKKHMRNCTEKSQFSNYEQLTNACQFNRRPLYRLSRSCTSMEEFEGEVWWLFKLIQPTHKNTDISSSYSMHECIGSTSHVAAKRTAGNWTELNRTERTSSSSVECLKL
jgi:hypothetical protein